MNYLRRGHNAELELADIHFSGLLIGEDVPMPVTADEIARFVPTMGRISVQELYQRVIETHGAERTTEQNVLSALQRYLNDHRFGYAATETELIQPGAQIVKLTAR